MNAKSNRFVRRLIFSYSALLVVILVMGVYLYNITIKNVSNEIIAQNRLTLEKAVNDMDIAFETMDVLASQVVAISDIVQMANNENNGSNEFYLQAYYAVDALSLFGFTETILPIKDYYIYLKNPGYILSASQFTETELYYIGAQSYHRDKYNEWLEILDSDNMFRKFNLIDPFKPYSDKTYLYMLPLNEYSFKYVPATICYEIDYAKLNSIFEELKYYDSGYLFAVDAKGNRAFSILGDSVSDIPLESLKALDFTNGFANFNQDGTAMYVTKAPSNRNDWEYYLVQPSDKVLYSLNTYRNIFVMIILAGLFIEVIMILFLSRTNLRKFSQLGSELENTLTKQQDLQKMVETQKPLIQQSYLSKIIKGCIATQQELEYAQQYLDIDTQNRKFGVLYMVSYINQYELYVENAAVTVPEDTNYKDIVEKILRDSFPENTYIMNNREGEYAILISRDAHETAAQSTEVIKEAFCRCHDYLKNHYSIWTFAGMGSWNNGLMIIWNSYQQATEALSYATKRHIFHNYESIEKDSGGFYYPIELTKKLTNFVSSGNKEQVLEIFDIIRRENMEERTLSIPVMKYLLSDIRNTLYKIRFTITENQGNQEDLRSIDALFDQHMSLKLCEDLAISLCLIFEDSAGSNKLISTIKNYIDNNYKDPSLCLTKISDEFSISESYFSYLFKEEVGENFSSYLGRTRMEHAYMLLKESDINISEIYEKVGYNNSHTFRRAFKKIYGMSPKEARSNERTA